jgi:TolB protein
MRRIFWFAIASFGALLVLVAQDVRITLQQGERPAIAIPDFRGSGTAQNFMGPFNETLWSDVEQSGILKMVPKTMYPVSAPQRPSDFGEPPPVEPARGRGKKGAAPAPTSGGGLWMADWSSPPASANYLAIGYTADQNGVFVLYGWLFDLSRGAPATAQVIGKRYFGSLDETGARQVAHQFAADIISQFGGKSLLGTKIYFVSTRTGHKEIWVMDPDGSNQKQITHFNSISIEPTISPDGSKVAFTSYARGNPGIFVFSVDPIRQLLFYNQVASVNETPEFTPDGKQIIYSSSAGGCCSIFSANLDGSNLRRISSARSIEVEPKINPKTGATIAFVSGRSGPQQIYLMNLDGTDVERLTPGEGEASNPSWHPDGQHLAYSWTRGFATGNFNLFIMDVATRSYTQLTHSEGRNENPTWASDGYHIAFQSTRTGTPQIWTMLADGTGLRQLTTQGSNLSPSWGK